MGRLVPLAFTTFHFERNSTLEEELEEEEDEEQEELLASSKDAKLELESTWAHQFHMREAMRGKKSVMQLCWCLQTQRLMQLCRCLCG